MSTAQAILLASRGIVEVAGPEAANFLQGLITNDIARVSKGQAIYAALLTAQGKIIHDFLIAAAPEGGFWLDCAKVNAVDLVARLTRYKLRAKVTLADRSAELAVVAFTEKPAAPPATLFEDPRLPALGFRAIVPIASVAALSPVGEEAYHARRVALAVPEGGIDIPPESFFPLDCNFEELHGVDFDKGCYVGQELTARMKHRTSARRRVLPVAADVALPAAGTALKIGATEIGELRGSLSTQGLALVRLDRLGNAEQALADGVTVRIGRPAYPLILPTGDKSS
jgi:folate-binding protein YgfZ